MMGHKVIDLSHTLETDMPVYPGTEPPRIDPLAKVANEGYAELLMKLTSHTGTHLDCPAHLFEKGFAVDDINASQFYGQGFIIDCRSGKSGKIIRQGFLHQYEPQLEKAEFALFCTGWSQLWCTPQYNENFPVLDEEAAEYLASFHLKGAGFDTPSADPVGSVDLTVHRILLGANVMLIENLTNLGVLVDQEFEFACFPLKLRTGDGSPVRAVGILS